MKKILFAFALLLGGINVAAAQDREARMKELQAMMSRVEKFRSTPTADGKDSILQSIMKQYTEDSITAGFFGEMQCDLAAAWLQAGRPDKCLYYSKMIKPEFNRYYNVFHSLPILQEAAMKGKQLQENLQVVDFLFENRKDILEQHESMRSGVLYSRGLLLHKTGKSKEGLADIAESVTLGHYNHDLKPVLKEVYTKANGAAGCDKFVASLLEKAYKRVYDSTHKKQLATPKAAPEFTLTNLKGETVSLASLKGKVVVLDFWGTWCGWCIKAFPGMQLAVDEYKNDKDVVFLFIDAFEQPGTAKEKVNKFMSENTFTFNVLLDEDNKVVQSFGYNGLPTKAVINKKGEIVFESAGYDGSDGGVALNVKAMVEIAKKM